MRVVLLTIGSRGDVDPVLAVGAGLVGAGHEVVVGTHDVFRSDVEDCGLGFAPVVGDPQAMMGSGEVQRLLASRGNPVRMIKGFVDLLRPRWEAYVASCGAACRDAEAVLYSPLGFAGWHLAEAAGIPSAVLALQPFAPSRHQPPATVGGARSLGSVGNRAAHALQHQLAWQLVRPLVDRWRSEELGIPKLGRRSLQAELNRRREPVFHGYSRFVVPHPPDWPAWIETTGYWFLERPQTVEAAVADFVAGGPAPVYAGFGSMADEQAGALAEMLIAALRRTGRRGILATGWGGLAGLAGDDVLVVDEVPHAWLFARCSVVIHHGGAGTTAAALRAGVPQVVIPYFGDQYYWARRVARLGAGCGPLSRKRLDVEMMQYALATADAEGPRRAARGLARLIAGEDGVGAAVAGIRRWVLSH